MKHFTTAEFARSSTADRLAIDNRIPKAVLPNIVNLVDKVLDLLREAWGAPITVNSGYRCEELNKAVGGVTTSEHLVGCAADITAGSISDNKKLFKLILELDLPFNQLILEKGGRWIHISHKENNKHQILYT